MTEEQERQIARVLSVIREEIDELDDLVTRAKYAADSLTKALGDRSGYETLNEVLQTLDKQFPAIKVEIEEMIAETVNSWNSAIEANKAAISQALGTADAALTAVRTGLSSIAGGIEVSHAFIKQIDEQRGAAFDSAQQVIEASFEAAEEVTDALGDAVVAQFEAFSEHFSTLAAQINDTLESGAEKVDEQLEQPISELSKAIDEAMADFRDFLVVNVKDEILEQVETAFMEPAKYQISELIKKIENEIVRLGDEAIGGSEDAAEKRQELKTAVDILRSAVDPALDALNGLRGLAGTVGISI